MGVKIINEKFKIIYVIFISILKLDMKIFFVKNTCSTILRIINIPKSKKSSFIKAESPENKIIK